MNLQSTLEIYAGGPGSGCQGPNCGRKVFYHGTSSRNVSGILKRGILPNRNSNDIFTKKNHVYVATNLNRAKYWAEGTAADIGGKPVVLRVTVPASLARNVKKDWTGKGDRKFEGHIPKEYVKMEKKFEKVPDWMTDENPEGIP